MEKRQPVNQDERDLILIFGTNLAAADATAKKSNSWTLVFVDIAEANKTLIVSI